MAVSIFDEQRLRDAMQDYVDTTKKADKFMKNATLQSNLIGRIAIEISQIHHMSVTEARSYIDGRTGRFQPGRRLHVCPSDKIQGLFNQLEAVTSEINRCPWITNEDALRAVATKKNYVQQLAADIKRQPGGQEVIDRVKRQIKAPMNSFDFLFADIFAFFALILGDFLF